MAPNYLSCFIESLLDLGNIFASAARTFRTATPFAADD
jgi:hypothetical protein